MDDATKKWIRKRADVRLHSNCIVAALRQGDPKPVDPQDICQDIYRKGLNAISSEAKGRAKGGRKTAEKRASDPVQAERLRIVKMYHDSLRRDFPHLTGKAFWDQLEDRVKGHAATLQADDPLKKALKPCKPKTLKRLLE